MSKHKLKFKFLSILVLGGMLFHLTTLTFARENIFVDIVLIENLPCNSHNYNDPGGWFGAASCVSGATCVSPAYQMFAWAYANESCPDYTVDNDVNTYQVNSIRLGLTEQSEVRLTGGIIWRLNETLDCGGYKTESTTYNPGVCNPLGGGGGDPGGGDPGGDPGGGDPGGGGCSFCYYNWIYNAACQGPEDTFYCGGDYGAY